MLRTTKNMKEKYEKIQNLIFSLIPEKWEAIYLYASVGGELQNSQKGELFFYYIPKGILKKKPINVYEVPERFNISENQYLEIVKELYYCIKDLRQDFVDTDQKLWTNLTISIVNFKFKIEYSYEDLPLDEKENNERHVIWRYKYLGIGGEKKEERRILDNYFLHEKEMKKEIYETGVYIKTENNMVMFDKEEIRVPEKIVIYEKEDKFDKTNKNEANQTNNNENGNDDNQKNQILNI